MDCDIPEAIEGQTSINELLVALGEPPVENIILDGAPDDAAELFADAPMLPGIQGTPTGKRDSSPNRMAT